MVEHLKEKGFKNVQRFEAYRADIGVAGTTLSHIRLAYEIMKIPSDYVIVLEDDAYFNDVDKLNAAFNEAIKRYDFAAFIHTIPEKQERVVCPLDKTYWLAHCIIYKRARSAELINHFIRSWLMVNTPDAWTPYDRNVCIYTGDACIQLRETFDSDGTAKFDESHIYVYIHDRPINESVIDIIKTHSIDVIHQGDDQMRFEFSQASYQVYYKDADRLYRVMDKNIVIPIDIVNNDINDTVLRLNIGASNKNCSRKLFLFDKSTGTFELLAYIDKTDIQS